MEDVRANIAKNINALRSARSMTQSELAHDLNYSDKAVSKWERGESVPDITVLVQIAKYFSVSVDYLISDGHYDEEVPDEKITRIRVRNRFIVSALSVFTVWLIASFLFVGASYIPTVPHLGEWLMFVYAVPISAVVALIFNTIWGIKKINYIIISVIMWSAIASLYLSLLVLSGLNFWLLFVLGVPGEVIIIFWSGLISLKRTHG